MQLQEESAAVNSEINQSLNLLMKCTRIQRVVVTALNAFTMLRYGHDFLCILS